MLCRVLLLATAGAMLAVSSSSPASAATRTTASSPDFTVTSTADLPDAAIDGVCDDGSGACTLRAAVMEADVAGYPISIEVPAGTYVLSTPRSGLPGDAATGDLDIRGRVTISGAGAATTIVDGGGLDRIFRIEPSASAAISGLTIRNGNPPGTGNPGEDDGGGILNNGLLTLDDSTLSGNSTTILAFSYGGGIAVEGGAGASATLTNVTVTGNSTYSGGGGVAQNDYGATPGSLEIVSSTITGNAAAAGGGVATFGGDASIVGSTVSGNTAQDPYNFFAGYAGGVYVHGGTMTVADSVVGGNSSDLDAGGIGVNNAGALTISGSTIENNRATASTRFPRLANGAGLLSDGGTVVIQNSTVRGNTTGGKGASIFQRNGGTLTVEDTEITANASSYWGNVYVNGGSATFDRVRITGNTIASDGGGIVEDRGATVSFTNGTIAGNTAENGGALALDSAHSGRVTVEGSTLSGNRAAYGGAIWIENGDTLVVTNSTISGNTATREGGAAYLDAGIANFTFTTIADNTAFQQGGNLAGYSASYAHYELADSIVAHGLPDNCHIAVTSSGYNIDDGSSCGFGTAGDQSGVDPLLVPLADNGGPGQTRALRLGSPAIDHADPACPPPGSDQRGVGRPQGGGCDVGAFETTETALPPGRPTILLSVDAPTETGPQGGEIDVNAIATDAGAPVRDASVRIVTGPDLGLRTGETELAQLGDLALGAQAQHTFHVQVPTACEDADYTYDVYADFAGRVDPPPHVQRTIHVPGECGTLSGTITYSEAGNYGPLEDAEIDVCPLIGNICDVETSADDGTYQTARLPIGEYSVVVRPPQGFPALTPLAATTITIGPGQDVTADFELFAATPTPPGTSCTGSAAQASASGICRVNSSLPWLLTRTGCPNGSAAATIRQGGQIIFQQAMSESPAGSGIYSVQVPPLPNHPGYMNITTDLTCPGGGGGSGSSSGYIDPSGTVVDAQTGSLIVGATVTLLHATSAAGPFVPVPDASAIMSIQNRRNPDVTDSYGAYGWDVLAGFYEVRAEKAGCDPATSAVLDVPPAVVDLVLPLHCDHTPPFVDAHADVVAEATGPGGANVSFTAPAASDDRDGAVPVTCAPASGSLFPLGHTTVHCSARDALGNTGESTFDVVVQDTTAPSLTVPAGVTANAASAAGALVTYTATASDLVEGTISASCDPVSGGVFPIGHTTVTCVASDQAGNRSSPRTFDVFVKGAGEQLADVVALVDGLNAKKTKKFEHELQKVQEALARGRLEQACHELDKFALKVRNETAKTLTADEARQLIAAVTRIEAVLGC